MSHLDQLRLNMLYSRVQFTLHGLYCIVDNIFENQCLLEHGIKLMLV